ncbi:hypothetical protein GE061_004439 [Apolygus lucorum]|uniref:RNase H type-1 domain-containing protein n=1 Tax=Apolygus lucorum TaxID=248454 RepID=A0A8S9WZ62_APOLU|nr:hypothetical protein GE061_004439 [Apolygus lucorum]
MEPKVSRIPIQSQSEYLRNDPQAYHRRTHLRILEKKVEPILCNSFTSLSQSLPWIQQSHVPFQYLSDYKALWVRSIITKLPEIAYSTPSSAESHLREHLALRYPNATYIFTDGSVIHGNVGCAVYAPSLNETLQRRIWDHATIYTAEAFAIYESLQLVARTRTSDSTIIVTDCQSVLTKLWSANPGKKMGKLETEIKQKLLQLQYDGINTRFIWVRSHQGIVGNDIADRNAKIAAMNVALPAATPWVPPTDLKKMIAAEITKKWKIQHENYHAGQRYIRIFPPPRLHAWFDDMPLRSKMFFKTLSRLRTGHSCTKKYLFKIRRSTSELCDLY